MKCICPCGEETYKTYETLKEGKLCVKCGYANRKVLFGPANPSYNPEITDEDRRGGRRFPVYKEWAKCVKQRDGYKCVICSSKKNIVSHHLNGYDKFPELRVVVSNGVTLCSVCHAEFHKSYGYGGNTKEQFYCFKLTKEVDVSAS